MHVCTELPWHRHISGLPWPLCRCEIYSLWETMISLESFVFYARKRITSPAGPDVIIFLDTLVPEYLIPLS